MPSHVQEKLDFLIAKLSKLRTEGIVYADMVSVATVHLLVNPVSRARPFVRYLREVVREIGDREAGVVVEVVALEKSLQEIPFTHLVQRDIWMVVVIVEQSHPRC